MKRFIVAMIFALGAAGQLSAQKTVYAPPEIVDLGVANVRLEMYGWESTDQRFTPASGLACGDGSMHDQLLSGRYQMALAGRWPAGSREVFGFVGGPYTNESKLEVSKFERSDRNIDIVLRRLDTGGKGDGYRSWKVLYVSALMPSDLAEGKYSVQCTVQNANGQPDPMTKATPQCDLEVPNPQEAEAKSAREKLKELADEELAREFLTAGRALGNSKLAPRETPFGDVPPYEFNDVQYVRFNDIGNEIVRRGGQMIPWVMAMLERQAPASSAARDPHPLGFARSIVDLIVRINDPRPVPLLVDVVEGLDGKVIASVRANALGALERMTFVTFRRQTLNDGRSQWCVEDPRALPTDGNDPLFGARGANGQATAFRAWLSREGQEPEQWLPLAVKRAHEAIDGRDLRAIYSAADFLQFPGMNRDDQPDATLARIGAILDHVKQVGFRAGSYDYQLDGRLLPVTITDWTAKLAFYGTRARPWAKALVRIDQEIAVPSGLRIEQMTQVGGEDVVEYLVKRLPEWQERLAAAAVDAKANPDQISEERLQQLLIATQRASWGLSRWTGRIFDNPRELIEWWEQNADKSQGSWLRESLDETAQRADGGDEVAKKLLTVLVPEIAHDGSKLQWLRRNQLFLGYDERNGCFKNDPAAWP